MKEQLLAKLKAAKNEQEWNSVCDEAKAYTRTLPLEDRSGDYPTWWYVEVICSIRPPR